jgi:hypothetical protein
MNRLGYRQELVPISAYLQLPAFEFKCTRTYRRAERLGTRYCALSDFLRQSERAILSWSSAGNGMNTETVMYRSKKHSRFGRYLPET